MIIGIGTDIVKVKRIENLYNKHGDIFLHKVFTKREVEYCKQKKKRFVSSLAMRFAAKEAFLKAIKTGLRANLKFCEIEVLNDELGAPYLNLYDAAKEYATELKVEKIHISLSDEAEYAIATIILERK